MHTRLAVAVLPISLAAGLTLTSAVQAETRTLERFGPIRHQAIPGGIALIALDRPVDSISKASLGERVLGLSGSREGDAPDERLPASDGNAVVLFGIGLSTEPGTHRIRITAVDGSHDDLEFTVEPHAYEEQRIVIKDTNKVNPAPLDLERIKRENQRLATVKSTRSARLLAEKFEQPVQGILTSPFGLRRFFNDQPRRPHGGIDIAADTGTPIIAPAMGVVVDADEYFFNGNSVFIEHGLGLQTFYAHMSRIDVEEGDVVEAGDVIGAVGATGRVTGPHLHWSVGLNGTWVDPSLVMDAPVQ